MGRRITVIGISLLILISGGISIYHTYQVKETVSNMISEAKAAAEAGEIEKAAKLADEAAAYWEHEEQSLIIFTHHTEIDTMTDVMSKLPSLIKYNNTSIFCSEADQALSTMEHIWLTQLPLIQNIL